MLADRQICMYVCVYVIFIRCDRRTSSNKHKKQSQNDIQYKAEKPKSILPDKAIYTTDKERHKHAKPVVLEVFFQSSTIYWGSSVAEWLACYTQAQ